MNRKTLIPRGTVVTHVIQRTKPPATTTPIATRLILRPPPDSVPADSTVTLTGRLVDAESYAPVAGSVITILDSDMDRGDRVAVGISQSKGDFVIEWAATNMDRWDRTAELYTRFEGDDQHKASES